MIAWCDLPLKMQNDAVRKYYDILMDRKPSIVLKRIFDFITAMVCVFVLSPIIAFISILIPLDSKGGVLFKQERVTTYGKHFYIYKFRTMVQDAEKIGNQLTTSADPRITRVGKFLRRFHLDEIPQLFNIIKGEMSFVGTRPEVPKFVNAYTDEMLATLLLPAGITSMASIMYKDEYQLISNVEDADSVYLNSILPDKMQYNLQALEKFSVLSEIGIIFKTFFSVFIKEDKNTKSLKSNKALIIVEDARSLILTRKELLLAIKNSGYSIDIFTPIDENCETLNEMGFRVIEASFDRRSTNPFNDLKLLFKYIKLTKEKYDFAITYSVKANIYGGIAMRIKNIPYYLNITGTGSAFYNGGLLKTIIKILYRPSSQHATGVFFENSENRDVFVNYKLCKKEATYVLSGAGINTDEFQYRKFPHNQITKFLYIGRLMEEKGIEDLYPIIKEFNTSNKKAVFEFLGDFEDEYKESFEKFLLLDNVVCHGYHSDVKEYIEQADCLILPSYHEGMANVLLEAGALGRPLIASDIAGCREAVDNFKNGYLFKVKDTEDIKDKINRFLSLSFQEKEAMGKHSREFIKSNFERKNVVDNVINIIGVKQHIEQHNDFSTPGELARV